MVEMTRREHKERTTRIWYCYCTSHAGINCFRTSHLSVGLEKLSDVLPRPPVEAERKLLGIQQLR